VKFFQAADVACAARRARQRGGTLVLEFAG
jgi:hypothetical protein